MKKLLIIYPHWYPSNLAGVHRSRLVGNYLHEFGWDPLILTVNSKYYEEVCDSYMERLFTSHFIEYRVDAWKITKPRLIGDIGLRAFWQLYKKGKEIIHHEKPDFLWIPIPSFYTALLGRFLHRNTGISYGIDYIDPWVRDISKDGSLRARLSLLSAKILEPIALKNASLVTGVAWEYFKPVLDRNFKDASNYKITYAEFPYGFDPNDHEIDIPDLKLPWSEKPDCIPIVYAGAFMPNSQVFLDTFFKAFAALTIQKKISSNIHLYFLGTGYYPHKSITSYAEDHNISPYVTEIRSRFPFLHILNFLSKANKLLIIGSTEKHYTASKTYQVILSNRPFMGIFHHESTAVKVLQNTNTHKFLVPYKPEEAIDKFYKKMLTVLESFISDNAEWSLVISSLEPYSAKQSAKTLVNAIESVIVSKLV